jgi:hypothetical protein
MLYMCMFVYLHMLHFLDCQFTQVGLDDVFLYYVHGFIPVIYGILTAQVTGSANRFLSINRYFNTYRLCRLCTIL